MRPKLDARMPQGQRIWQLRNSVLISIRAAFAADPWRRITQTRVGSRSKLQMENGRCGSVMATASDRNYPTYPRLQAYSSRHIFRTLRLNPHRVLIVRTLRFGRNIDDFTHRTMKHELSPGALRSRYVLAPPRCGIWSHIR